MEMTERIGKKQGEKEALFCFVTELFQFIEIKRRNRMKYPRFLHAVPF